MATIPHGELGDRSGEVLRRVAAGETFEVTRHGEVAALIVPAGGTVLERLTSAGAVRPARVQGGFREITRGVGDSTKAVLVDLLGDR